MDNEEFMCVMGKSPDGEKVPCIYPNCKRESCFVYQMQVLGIPVYNNRERKDE